jgi:8-oxo-dGTP diphosphatase
MKIIDKLAWIEIQNKSILLTKSFGKDTYYIPGGKRELGETDEEALFREIKEELCVEIKKETMVFIGIFEAQAHGHTEGVTVKMNCYKADYEGVLKANSEIEAVIWYNYADREKLGDVDKLIFDYLKKHNLID